jgi:hypothetical protein
MGHKKMRKGPAPVAGFHQEAIDVMASRYLACMGRE